MCAFFIDEIHRAGYDPHFFNEGVIDVSEDVDDCVADTQ